MKSNEDKLTFCDNHELSNLYLSFDLYMNHINTACKYYRQSTDDEVLKAIAWFERRSKYLFLNWLNTEHNKMASCYKAKVDIDLYKFVDFFETLDIWFTEVYLKNGVAIWNSNLTVMVNHYKKLECLQLSILTYSANKLTKIARKIIHELYRDQYSIDPYSHTDISPLSENFFMNEEFTYNYFFLGEDRELINQYIGAAEKYTQIYQTASESLSSLITTAHSLYEKYGDNIAEQLSFLLTLSYQNRLCSIVKMRDSLQKNHGISIALSFEDFFSTLETFTFRIKFPAVYCPEKSWEKPEKDIIDKHVISMKEKFGTQIEHDIRKMYFDMIQLESSVKNYIALSILQEHYIVLDPQSLFEIEARQICSCPNLQD